MQVAQTETYVEERDICIVFIWRTYAKIGYMALIKERYSCHIQGGT